MVKIATALVDQVFSFLSTGDYPAAAQVNKQFADVAFERARKHTLKQGTILWRNNGTAGYSARVVDTVHTTMENGKSVESHVTTTHINSRQVNTPTEVLAGPIDGLDYKIVVTPNHGAMDIAVHYLRQRRVLWPITGHGTDNNPRERLGIADGVRGSFVMVDSGHDHNVDVPMLIRRMFASRDAQLHIRDPALTCQQIQNAISVYVCVNEASRQQGLNYAGHVRPEIWCPIQGLAKVLRAIRALDAQYAENTRYGVFSINVGVDPEKNPPDFGPEDADEYNEHRASVAEYHQALEETEEKCDAIRDQVLAEPREERATFIKEIEGQEVDVDTRFGGSTTTTPILHRAGPTLQWYTEVDYEDFHPGRWQDAPRLN